MSPTAETLTPTNLFGNPEYVTVFVPCIPVAQPRQRHRVIPGQSFAQNYTPKSHPVQDFKAHVRLVVRTAWKGGPWDGPISLVAVFVFPRPKRLKNGGRVWHDKKPDADNVLKALKDSLKEIAWRDDSQVAEVCVRKKYAASTEEPGVELTIRRAN
jgi:Holliday junction resolvase RusA-like endonuclease